MPLRCTAADNVLLAHLSPEARAAILPERLPHFTEKSITNCDAPESYLAKVCRQGYAITHEEWAEGINLVAALIHDSPGRDVATVSVSGLGHRIGPWIDRFVEFDWERLRAMFGPG